MGTWWSSCLNALRFHSRAKPPPPALEESAERWVAGCKFEPAVLDGKPVATRAMHVFLFLPPGEGPETESLALGDRAQEPPNPLLLGSGMTPPLPASCPTPKPVPPPDASEDRVKGLVLVAYVVHSDGSVDSIELKDPAAPPMLFGAVRDWLRSCHFEPARQKGKPITVKIIQPFTFKMTSLAQ